MQLHVFSNSLLWTHSLLTRSEAHHLSASNLGFGCALDSKQQRLYCVFHTKVSRLRVTNGALPK